MVEEGDWELEPNPNPPPPSSLHNKKVKAFYGHVIPFHGRKMSFTGGELVTRTSTQDSLIRSLS